MEKSFIKIIIGFIVTAIVTMVAGLLFGLDPKETFTFLWQVLNAQL